MTGFLTMANGEGEGNGHPKREETGGSRVIVRHYGTGCCCCCRAHLLSVVSSGQIKPTIMIRSVLTKSSLVKRSVVSAAVRYSSTEAAAAAKVNLNFALPHETIYKDTPVSSVIIPGSEGEYGVAANHVPYLAEMKPGVLQILHDEGSTSEPEKYFVPGGFAFTHANSTTVSQAQVRT